MHPSGPKPIRAALEKRRREMAAAEAELKAQERFLAAQVREGTDPHRLLADETFLRVVMQPFHAIEAPPWVSHAPASPTPCASGILSCPAYPHSHPKCTPIPSHGSCSFFTRTFCSMSCNPTTLRIQHFRPPPPSQAKVRAEAQRQQMEAELAAMAQHRLKMKKQALEQHRL